MSPFPRGWPARVGAAAGAIAAAGALADLAALWLAKAGHWGPQVHSRQAQVAGARGAWLEAGQGEPVVLLASTLVRAQSYLPLLRALAPHRRVLVVELPGSGASSRVLRPWSIDRYSAWVSALLRELDLDGVTLIGHSVTGAVALQLGASEPRVARLILVGSIGARARGGVGRVTAARLVDALKEPGLNLRVWWHLASNLLVHPRSLLHQVKLAGHASVLEDARRVRVPTLLAWGRLDRTMPLDCARRLQACIPGSSLVVGPGSHDWLITHARHFARMVLERRF